MTVHALPRRYEPKPVEDAGSVYRELRSAGVRADLAHRAARAMHPARDPATSPAGPALAAPVAPEPVPVVDPPSRWRSPYEATLDGEWWQNNWLTMIVVGGLLAMAIYWIFNIALIVAWLVARAVWVVTLTVLAGILGGVTAALLHR